MKDRLIQLAAFVVLIAALTGAFMMTPGINQQRIDQKLTYNIDTGDDTNPVYTFVSLLGPVRGFMINVLWQRSEALKQEGKFFEANHLAQMITTLQPRYPEAWNFQGWNMAYNISVKCKTKEERWDWVKKGMDLIRDRGIPNNPNGVVLYRSLAWILGHKMGGQTDDMHWHYKMEFAEEWHVLMGVPDPRGFIDPKRVTPDDEKRMRAGTLNPVELATWNATLAFARINDDAQKYLRKPNRPDDDYNASNYYATMSPDVRQRFFEDHPGMAEFVAQLEAIQDEDGKTLGLGLNPRTLRAIGRVGMFKDAGYKLSNPLIFKPETLGEDGYAYATWQRTDEALKHQKQVPVLVNMLRALTLIADYHMDPAFMLQCMNEYGPMDWRHPSAHACYWTRLGTLRSETWIDNKARIDLVNAHRATIHALQNLAHWGKITFKPAVPGMTNATINNEPDTRMIPSYEQEALAAIDKVKSGAYGENHEPRTYYDGHENFLHSAITLLYFEGKKPLAEHYFKDVKERYGERESSVSRREGHYNLQLVEDFVIARLEDSLRFQKIAYIKYWIRLAYEKGVRNSQREQAEAIRYLNAARSLYEKLEKDSQTEKRNDDELVAGRQAIPETFEQLVLKHVTDNMIGSSHYSMAVKASIWQTLKRQYAKLIDAKDADIYNSYRGMILLLRQQYDLMLSAEQAEQEKAVAMQRAKLMSEGKKFTPEQLQALADQIIEDVRVQDLYRNFPPPAGYGDWLRNLQLQQQQTK